MLSFNKIISTALIASVGFNLYLLNEEVVVEDSLDQEIEQVIDDKISVAQSGLKKTSKDIVRVTSQSAPLEKNEKINEPTEQIIDEQKYQELSLRSKKLWQRKISDLIEIKLGFDEETTDKYYKLKELRTKDIDNFFAQFEKEGPIYLGLEDRIELSKIDVKYLIEIKEIFGKDYSRYKELLNQHNKEMMEESMYFYPVEL